MSHDRPSATPRHSDYQRQAATHFAHRGAEASTDQAGQRLQLARELVSAVLLLVALLLPWDLHFGVGVPGSARWLFGVVIVMTVLSWASLLTAHVGSSPDSSSLRLALNAPYLAVVAVFAGLAVVEAVRFGGTGEVPAGVGPGVLAGLAGALLAAQPVREPDDIQPAIWSATVRVVGIAAMALAGLAVVSNIYYRTRFVFPNIGNAAYGSGNAAVVATAVVYGLVALIAAIVGLRWLLSAALPARLATVALGTSALVGSALVWTVGIGRDIDAFRGIAQTTSTTAVGFEAYLAWVGAAAIAAPISLRQALRQPPDKSVWHEAVRKCLSLIAVWFVGCAVLRVFDLITTASLGLPLSPYDSVGLLAFDVVAAAVAVWVRFNITNDALHPVVISALCGVLFVLSVCRVAVGVGLAPRIQYAGAEDIDTTVYGNSLAQQITSTFDVVMCALALAVAAAAAWALRRADAPSSAATPALAPAPPVDPSPSTEILLTQALDRTPRWSADATQHIATPKIARVTEPATQQFSAPGADDTERLRGGSPMIARVLDASTQRFAAGTTYTGTRRKRDADGDTR